MVAQRQAPLRLREKNEKLNNKLNEYYCIKRLTRSRYVVHVSTRCRASRSPTNVTQVQ